MMPDLIHFFLSGEKANEFSNATTTQFFNPRTKTWAEKLLKRFDIPQHIFGKIVEPGTKLGKLGGSVAEQTGLRGVEVILPGTHDTASAECQSRLRAGRGSSPIGVISAAERGR